MPKPRRVHRRLILPPGWIALAFLLLLGCQALQQWGRQLKNWNVLQVTMPPLKVDTSYVHSLKENTQQVIRNEFNLYVTPLSTVGASMLQKMRPWHSVEFNGNSLTTFLSAAATESAIQKIIVDTSHAGGVRVRFLPGATYANLVRVLDIMSYTNQKKYFLDIWHQPATLYAITNEPLPIHSAPLFMSGCIRLMPPPPVKTTLHQLLAEFWQQVESLGGQTWRLPVALLIMLSILNFRQLLCVSFYQRNS